MDIDFENICRVCMKDGVMMSLFKVNISKKLMALATVQVWPSDGLPDKICNRCSAKLHISFQFKRQCEKSDSKLREILRNRSNEPKEQEIEVQTHEIQQPQTQFGKLDQDITQLTQVIQQNNCVYIECNPTLETVVQDQNYIPVSQNEQIPMTSISYNIQQQNHLQLSGYTIQNVAPVQVYNGTYTMPLQSAQTNMITNQGVTSMQIHPQIQQPIIQQPQPVNITVPTSPTMNQEKNGNSVENTKKQPAKEDVAKGKQCSICNKMFSTTTKLSRHMKTHSTDQPYKCTVCSKQFSHGGNFKIHMRMHADERPFKCVVCNKGCRQAQDLEKHMRTHTGEKPHKCHFCPRAFSNSSNLIAHIRTHTGERPYVCCVCQKAFCQSNELTKHMRTHTGEKSHICDICHRGFNGSSTLIVHRRSHTGERPYVCIICNKGFAQSSCLAVHMKRHKKDKTFMCSECDLKFESFSDLQDHLTQDNVCSEKRLVCKVCGKKCSTLEEVNKHIRTHSDSASGGEVTL